jgi:hypothetical protein
MRTATASRLALVVAGGVFAGAALAAHKGQHSAPCALPQCNYAIKLDSCSEDGIHTDYEFIHVDKGQHRLHWVIVTPGYKFARKDGIKFSKPPTPPEFTRGTRVNDKEFSWVDKNPGQNKKDFKYDVRIVETSTGKECHYDPSVVNE